MFCVTVTRSLARDLEPKVANFKYELMDLSNTHNAIADWLIANPGKGQMGRCAVVFDYSLSWLSTLIHQDAFQALLKHKQGQAFQEVIIPLHEKMSGVAHAGVQKLGEIVDTTKDDRLVKEITKDMLSGLGYSANAAPAGPTMNIQNNTLIVDSDSLAEARARRSQRYGSPALESPSANKEPSPETSTPQLQDHQESEVGQARDVRSEHVNSSSPVYRVEEKGSEV